MSYLNPVNGSQITDGTVDATVDLKAIANNTILGNDSGGSASPQELSSSEVLAIIGVEAGADSGEAIQQSA